MDEPEISRRFKHASSEVEPGPSQRVSSPQPVHKSAEFSHNKLRDSQGSNRMNQSGRSRKSKASVLPGSIAEFMSPIAQMVFKCINDNEYKKLQIFLDQEGARVDVMQLKEQRYFTVLSLSAFKNHTQCFKACFRHALKFNAPTVLNGSTAGDTSISSWVNAYTDEKFTALHFASYHGNFELIKLMIDEMGANVNVTNVYGANCLHIAAQGDQPISLYYFAMMQGLDINQVDNKGSTPLHWACYQQSEFAIAYLLAMNPKLEVHDQAGYTPLHLAIRSVATLKSTRPVRTLLLRGASRQAVNRTKQTCT